MSRGKSAAHRMAGASVSPWFSASWARRTMSVLADTVRPGRRPLQASVDVTATHTVGAVGGDDQLAGDPLAVPAADLPGGSSRRHAAPPLGRAPAGRFTPGAGI